MNFKDYPKKSRRLFHKTYAAQIEKSAKGENNIVPGARLPAP